MRRARAVTPSLTQELCRLAADERAAFARHDIPTFIHCRLRWCELVLTLCPELSPASPEIGKRIARLLPAPSPELPRWKVELRARPLVAVVRRTVRTVTLPSGGLSHSCTEYLACGHVHCRTVALASDLHARRRRCKDCGAMRLRAIELRAQSMRTDVARGTASVVPISLRKGGRGIVSERSRRPAATLGGVFHSMPLQPERFRDGNR